MDNPEIGKIVDDLLGDAKLNYEYRQWLKKYEELCRKADDPALIQNKAEAITVVSIILEQGIDKEVTPFAPILHRLGMRLVDYLLRCDPIVGIAASENAVEEKDIVGTGQQGTKESPTALSGRYYASRTSYEFKGSNFSGFIDSTLVVWGTFTVSGNSLNLHITGDLDGEKSAFITYKIIDADTIADPGGSLYRRR